MTAYFVEKQKAAAGQTKVFISGFKSRGLASLVGAVLLTGCAGFQENIADGTFFDPTFWQEGPSTKNKNSLAELGLAALAKGDHVTAETQFQKALKRNPKDIHALLGMGILFQNRGMNVKAREMYEAILAIRPDNTNQMVVWQDQTTRPITEIASLNMALINSGGVVSGMHRGAAGEAQPYGITPEMPAANKAPMARVTASQSQMKQVPAAMPTAGQEIFVQADANIVSRFRTLSALRDQNLITGEEHNQRHQANIGALLPLTSPPPATGLDRPVPGTEQIAGRLRAIGRALEMRAMTVGQHAAERSMILDALMPSAPISVANPGIPPKGLMEAADAVRKLEQLQTLGLITTDQYARERRAVEGSLQPAGMAPKKAAMAMSPGEKAAGSGPGVHLASYRSENAAKRGWTQLKRAHKALLGGLSAGISKVVLKGKGTFWRLQAGPVASTQAAKALCAKLKARRQYCQPAKG